MNAFYVILFTSASLEQSQIYATLMGFSNITRLIIGTIDEPKLKLRRLQDRISSNWKHFRYFIENKYR